MIGLASFIYKDGEDFYFDTENYNQNSLKSLSIQFEDGDIIKWVWDDKRMNGVLRKVGMSEDLFIIKNVEVLN